MFNSHILRSSLFHFLFQNKYVIEATIEFSALLLPIIKMAGTQDNINECKTIYNPVHIKWIFATDEFGDLPTSNFPCSFCLPCCNFYHGFFFASISCTCVSVFIITVFRLCVFLSPCHHHHQHSYCFTVVIVGVVVVDVVAIFLYAVAFASNIYITTQIENMTLSECCIYYCYWWCTTIFYFSCC